MRRVTLILLAAFAAAACGKSKDAPASDAANTADALAPATWNGVAARFTNNAGEPAGEAVIIDAKDGVLLRLRVEGLSPGWHGAHLHMTGTCEDASAGFKASGAHVDPENHEHGLENAGGSERGDLPNIFAGEDGTATVEFFRANLHLTPSEAAATENGPFPLLDDDGFAVIIHANPDDHMTQPIGGAGDRVLCAAFKG
ncbi:MAG: superoxide dismutase family protein [Parvularculaceae bacterium]|nr:superoxide dismutase family protein [Parvularculaceae bacterium]